VTAWLSTEPVFVWVAAIFGWATWGAAIVAAKLHEWVSK
jgi:hypothetical protein